MAEVSADSPSVLAARQLAEDARHKINAIRRTAIRRRRPASVAVPAMTSPSPGLRSPGLDAGPDS